MQRASDCKSAECSRRARACVDGVHAGGEERRAHELQLVRLSAVPKPAKRIRDLGGTTDSSVRPAWRSSASRLCLQPCRYSQCALGLLRCAFVMPSVVVQRGGALRRVALPFCRHPPPRRPLTRLLLPLRSQIRLLYRIARLLIRASVTGQAIYEICMRRAQQPKRPFRRSGPQRPQNAVPRCGGGRPASRKRNPPLHRARCGRILDDRTCSSASADEIAGLLLWLQNKSGISIWAAEERLLLS